MIAYWTAKLVEEWIVEAAETSMALPPTRGPGWPSGSAWPEYVRTYGGIVLRPSPGSLSRMEKCWAWINALPSESDRRLLYGWAEAKARRSRKVADFAAEEGIKSRTLRWLVSSLCQAIADRLNGEAAVFRAGTTIDGVAEILAYEQPHSLDVSRRRRTPTFESPDVKPTFDTSPEALKRVAREITRSNRKLKKRRKSGTA